MTLRRFLLLPLCVSLALFVYFSDELAKSFGVLLDTVHITPSFVMALVAAAALQIVGHIIRAYKARYLLRSIKESSVRFQFRALSIGYLFNALLPFRIGELIRARIISGAMDISFTFSFVLILFERAVDAVMLVIAGLVLLSMVNGLPLAQLAPYITWLILVIVAVALILGLLRSQNPHLLKFWHRVTALLNETLKDAYRFKMWSVVYGLQRILAWRTFGVYALLSFVSWVAYAASVLIALASLLPNLSLTHAFGAAIAPYYGISLPAGPGSLGVFSDITGRVSTFLDISNTQQQSYYLVGWAVLVVPIVLVGIGLLFAKTKETVWQKRPRSASHGSLMNKLYRSEDISAEMANFLDSYLSGNTLSKVVHQLELQDKFRLIKYFKGGSDAITILVLQDGVEVVKKIIPKEFEDRLKAQHDWLVAHEGKSGIVRVLGEETAQNYYAIDLAYDKDNEPFFDYIHKHPIHDSERVMEDVWRCLKKDVYHSLEHEAPHPKNPTAYIEKHIIGCLEKAAAVDPELVRAADPDVLVINGKTYSNLHQILDKIKRHPKAWNDIANYQQNKAVHGDVIIDNLLVSKATGRVLIIDPAPDGNIINGPVFDFGKNMQSLYCGYEFLLRDEDPVYLVNGNEISYRDQYSEKYEQLSRYVRTELAPRYLGEAEQRAMLFHAASLFIRRLKHQVYYTPENALKFYAVGVKTLNEFLAQYDD